MTLYHILTPLSYQGHIVPIGKVCALQLSADKLQVLETVGAIAPVSPPPLMILPGWKDRATRLSSRQIIFADQFIETPDQTLASLLSESCDTIKTLKDDALSWLDGRK